VPSAGESADGEVQHARGVRVVVVEPVHQRSVDERRVAQRQAHRHADDAARSGPGEARDRVGDALGKILPPRSEGTADRIEYEILRAHCDTPRHVVEGESGGESGEPFRNRWGGSGHCVRGGDFLRCPIHDCIVQQVSEAHNGRQVKQVGERTFRESLARLSLSETKPDNIGDVVRRELRWGQSCRGLALCLPETLSASQTVANRLMLAGDG
jgi:hypothetical protein